jgi:hypothetical protein
MEIYVVTLAGGTKHEFQAERWDMSGDTTTRMLLFAPNGRSYLVSAVKSVERRLQSEDGGEELCEGREGSPKAELSGTRSVRPSRAREPLPKLTSSDASCGFRRRTLSAGDACV